jgi:hypothetical protein
VTLSPKWIVTQVGPIEDDTWGRSPEVRRSEHVVPTQQATASAEAQPGRTAPPTLRTTA